MVIKVMELKQGNFDKVQQYVLLYVGCSGKAALRR